MSATGTSTSTTRVDDADECWRARSGPSDQTRGGRCRLNLGRASVGGQCRARGAAKLANGKRKRCDIMSDQRISAPGSSPWPKPSPPPFNRSNSTAPPTTSRCEMTRWLSHLRAERRLSPKTLEAYARDLRQCLDFLCRALGRAGHAGAICRARGQRRQGLHGDAPRRRYRRPLADAGAGGLALVRPFPRTRGQGQGRRAVRDPRAQGRQEPAEADPDGRRPSASPMPTSAPARTAIPGSWRATPP